MKSMKKICSLIIVALLLAYPCLSFAAAAGRGAPNGLTGGCDGCLDKIDGTALVDGDLTMASNSTHWFLYRLDADSALAESSPSVIKPDTNAGDKRWISMDPGEAVLSMSVLNATDTFYIRGSNGTMYLYLNGTLSQVDIPTVSFTTSKFTVNATNGTSFLAVNASQVAFEEWVTQPVPAESWTAHNSTPPTYNSTALGGTHARGGWVYPVSSFAACSWDTTMPPDWDGNPPYVVVKWMSTSGEVGSGAGVVWGIAANAMGNGTDMNSTVANSAWANTTGTTQALYARQESGPFQVTPGGVSQGGRSMTFTVALSIAGTNSTKPPTFLGADFTIRTVHNATRPR